MAAKVLNFFPRKCWSVSPVSSAAYGMASRSTAGDEQTCDPPYSIHIEMQPCRSRGVTRHDGKRLAHKLEPPTPPPPPSLPSAASPTRANPVFLYSQGLLLVSGRDVIALRCGNSRGGVTKAWRTGEGEGPPLHRTTMRARVPLFPPCGLAGRGFSDANREGRVRAGTAVVLGVWGRGGGGRCGLVANLFAPFVGDTEGGGGGGRYS